MSKDEDYPLLRTFKSEWLFFVWSVFCLYRETRKLFIYHSNRVPKCSMRLNSSPIAINIYLRIIRSAVKFLDVRCFEFLVDSFSIQLHFKWVMFLWVFVVAVCFQTTHAKIVIGFERFEHFVDKFSSVMVRSTRKFLAHFFIVKSHFRNVIVEFWIENNVNASTVNVMLTKLIFNCFDMIF